MGCWVEPSLAQDRNDGAPGTNVSRTGRRDGHDCVRRRDPRADTARNAAPVPDGLRPVEDWRYFNSARTSAGVVRSP